MATKIDPKLMEAIDKFLNLLHRYDKTYWKEANKVGHHLYGKHSRHKRDDYYYYRTKRARKYVRLDGPYFEILVFIENGEMYYRRGGMPMYNRRVGNVYKMLDEKDWGKTIKRVYCLRRQGMGYPGESALIEEHLLSYKPGGHRPCDICRRTNNVKKTLDGYYCQYCRTLASRHMSSVRQLGGVPTHNGSPLYANEDFLDE